MKRRQSSRQVQEELCHSDGLAWKDIVYDIPVKSRSKAKRSGSSDDVTHTDPEKGGPASPSISSHLEPPASGTRRILHGVSGNVAQGSYVGLLGASGAGKTTLLNILSARLSKVGTLKGKVTYGGLARDPGSWKRTVGYVEQDDIMLPQHTVRETIEVAARLRLPNKEFTREEKMKRVEDTIDMLRLEGCENSRIGGGTTRGISGGERKRTSIAVELVSDVSLLFLDEPTSGLDSFAASLLVDNVSRIVKERNLACFMTVHQPSWAIFCKLDRVILLARGSVYYDGPPRETIPYFSQLGFDVPEGSNPADYFIGIAENKERDAEGEKRVNSLIEHWAEHVRGRGIEGRSEASLRTLHGQEGQGQGPDGDKARRTMKSKEKHLWPTPWWEEFGLLFLRWFREAVRDKQTLYGSIGQTVLLLIIIGFGFFRLQNTQSDVLPTIGVLFFVPINAIFSVLFPLLTPFAQQRALMFRERSAGLYRTSSFYFSKVALEIPNAVASRFIYYVVLYFMVGLRLSAGHFFIYLGINLLQLVVAVGLGLAVGAVSPTIEIANIIAPFVNVIFLLFGGTIQPSPPPWFVWLKWISPINYTFSALAQNEFGGREIRCNTGGGGAGGACYSSGDEVISAYNIGAFSIGEDAGFLCALGAVFFLLGYLGLRFTGKPQMRFK